MDPAQPATSYPVNRHSPRKEIMTWRDLAQGDAVVLLTSDKRNPRISGKVDNLSTDGSFLWLVQDNGAGRRLFHRTEGYTTLLDSTAS
jgi:hypothetical protein